MRSGISTAIAAGGLAVALAALALPANAAGHSVGFAHQTPVGQVSHGKLTKVCYSQLDNDNGVGIVSQNFEATFDAYDAQGADDFVMLDCGPVGPQPPIKYFLIAGTYFNGSGPADSYNVTLYKNAKGTPGKVKKACPNASYSDSGSGSPTINCKMKLKKNVVYWLSVQANLDFSAGGEWGWGTNNTVRGTPSQWKNPGDGFGTGCTTYTTSTTCIVAGQGGDNAFALAR